jgi:hypothetical protein
LPRPAALQESFRVKPSRYVMCVTFVLLATAAARAQDKLGRPQDEHFRMSAGVFAADTVTELRLDNDAGDLGTEIAAELDLGLRDHSDSGDVEVETRIRERHRVRFGYFKIDRNASKQLERQIEFGNDVYEIDDVVESTFDMRNFGVTYSYDVLRVDRATAGASFGINLVDITASAAVPARNIREDESRAGPSPVVGVHALVRITRRFHTELRAEYMQLNIDDFEGSVTGLFGAIVCRFNRNLGLGVGYKLLETEVDSNRVGETGNFRIENSGGVAFLRVAF